MEVGALPLANFGSQSNETVGGGGGGRSEHEERV